MPVDLAGFDPRVYDEPEHPITRRYQHEHTERWSAAYAFVLPEYGWRATYTSCWVTARGDIGQAS